MSELTVKNTLLQQIGNQQDATLVGSLINDVAKEVLRRYNWHILEDSGTLTVTGSTNTYTLSDDDIYVLLHAKTTEGEVEIWDKKLFDVNFPDPSMISGDSPIYLVPVGKKTVYVYPACSATITYSFIKKGKIDELFDYDDDFENTVKYGVLAQYYLTRDTDKFENAQVLFQNHLEKKVALYKPRQEEISRLIQDKFTRTLNIDRTSYRSEE